MLRPLEKYNNILLKSRNNEKKYYIYDRIDEDYLMCGDTPKESDEGEKFPVKIDKIREGEYVLCRELPSQAQLENQCHHNESEQGQLGNNLSTSH